MAFLSEDIFLRCKVTLWGIPTFLTLTRVKLNVGPEVNTEPTHFDNGKAFSSLDGTACSYTALTSFSFYQDIDKPRNWISWDLKKPSQFI